MQSALLLHTELGKLQISVKHYVEETPVICVVYAYLTDGQGEEAKKRTQRFWDGECVTRSCSWHKILDERNKVIQIFPWQYMIIFQCLAQGRDISRYYLKAVVLFPWYTITITPLSREDINIALYLYY